MERFKETYNENTMNILILGGTGFIGSHVMVQRPQWNWTVVNQKNHDLTDSKQVDQIQGDFDVVLDCAGFFGGIVFNQRNPREILYKNQIMNMNICRLIDRLNPKKFVAIGSACLYPGSDGTNLIESMIDQPCVYHPSVLYSAMAKSWLLQTMRTMQVPWEYLVLSNVYGPGEPLDFDRSHFVGSLINKIRQAQQSVELLGTGVSVRDFLFVKDAAEAICRYCERSHATNRPTNISTGIGTSVAEMAQLLIKQVNPDLTIKWGGNIKENGVLHKVLDNSKMKQDIAYSPTTSVGEGLELTWNWIKNNE